MNLIHKEFLIALANGEEVEFKYRGSWESIESSNCLGIFGNAAFEFRIKPKTVTLSMEIPMPFLPERGEEYWEPSGHPYGADSKNSNSDYDKSRIAIGVYRTEKEAAQAYKAQQAAIAKLLEGAK